MCLHEVFLPGLCSSPLKSPGWCSAPRLPSVPSGRVLPGLLEPAFCREGPQWLELCYVLGQTWEAVPLPSSACHTCPGPSLPLHRKPMAFSRPPTPQHRPAPEDAHQALRFPGALGRFSRHTNHLVPVGDWEEGWGDGPRPSRRFGRTPQLGEWRPRGRGAASAGWVGVTVKIHIRFHSHWVETRSGFSEGTQRPQAGGGFDGRKMEEGAHAPFNPCLDGRPPSSRPGSLGHFLARPQKALASTSLI